MKLHLAREDQITTADGQLVVLDVLASQGLVKVLRKGTLTEKFLPIADIRTGMSSGEISIKRPGELPSAALYASSPQWNEALRRATDAVVEMNALMQKTGLSACAAYEQLKRLRAIDPSLPALPSRASVMRYLMRHRNGLPLIKSDLNKGNRTARYSSSVTYTLESLYQRHFAVPHSRWRIVSFTQLVNQTLHEAAVLPSNTHVSRAFVRGVVNQLSANDPAGPRLDPKSFAAARSKATERLQVTLPLDRVEQDTVHLPWLVNVDGIGTTKVNLVHAIDCATGLVVGWRLVVGSPSVSDTLRCFENIFFSKAPQLENLGVESAIDLYGTPKLIVLDNGPENRSERTQAVARLGVGLKFCKARHPHTKPYIERLNRSLKEALEILPGTTRFDGVDGARDPEILGETSMTLEELERWIVRWYHHCWAHTKLERFVRAVLNESEHLGNTPAQRWEKIVHEHEYAIPLPPNREDWLMVKYIVCKRKVSRKSGVSLHDFQFRGPSLTHLIALRGEVEVDVLYDPEDFRSVFVPIPERGTLLELLNTSASPAMPAYTFVEAKEKIAQVSANHVPHHQLTAFARDALHAAVKPVVTPKTNGKTAIARDDKRARQATKAQASFQRAANPPAKPVATAIEQPIAEFSIDPQQLAAFEIRDRATGTKKP